MRLKHLFLLLLPFSLISQSSLIWSEDFSNGIPSTWSQPASNGGANWEYRGANTNPNQSIGSRGDYSRGLNGVPGPPINSPSASNGFVIFDSDYLDNGGSTQRGSGIAPAPHRGLLQTGVINLSAHPNVVLKMLSMHYCFSSKLYLLCSRDGGQSFSDSILINPLPSALSYSPPSDTLEINLSQQLGGASQAVIAFAFDGRFTDVFGNQGYHYWMIDDLELHDGPVNSMAFCPSAENGRPISISLFGHAGQKHHLKSIPQRFVKDFIAAASVVNNGSANQANVYLKMAVVSPSIGQVILRKSQKIGTLAAGDTLKFDTLFIRQDLPWYVSNYDLHFWVYSDAITGAQAPHYIEYAGFEITENLLAPLGDFGLYQSLSLPQSGSGGIDKVAVPFYLPQVDPELSNQLKVAIKGVRLNYYRTGIPSGDSIKVDFYADADFSPTAGISPGASPIFSDTLPSNFVRFPSPVLVDTGHYWLLVEVINTNAPSLSIRYQQRREGGEAVPAHFSGGSWSQNWNGLPTPEHFNISLMTDSLNCPRRSIYHAEFCDTGLIYVPLLNQFISQTGTFYDTTGMGSCPTHTQYMITVERPHVDTLNVNTCGLLYRGPSGTQHIGPGLHRDRVALNGQNCDSIYYINHQVTAQHSEIRIVSYCGAYYQSSWGEKFYQSGLYQHYIPDSLSCDTVILLDLDLTPVNVGYQIINNGTAVQALEPNATYQWLDCDLNRPVGGAQSRIYEPYYDGNFALIVNNGFCADTSECFSLATTGIRELSKEGIKVYPIPSQERLFLEISPEWSQSSYQIRDLQGRVLRAAELDQSSQQELALNVPEGLYILHIQKGARQLSFRILVKP